MAPHFGFKIFLKVLKYVKIDVENFENDPSSREIKSK